MLQTRFKDSPYLECRDTGFVKARLLRFNGLFISVDVSRNHDYVVCGYSGFIVQLFSLRTNRCLWIKNIAVQFKQYKEEGFSVVFHPFEDLIFASQLDKVLNINGKISSSPFHCDDSTSKFFTNKCFSKDKCTMVTSYKHTLTVWDVVKGEKKRTIRCNNVPSLCFSNSGRYLCVIKKNKGFQIFDVANNYKKFVYKYHSPSYDLDKYVVLFTVGLHSWCCCWSSNLYRRNPFIVNPTDENLPDLDLDSHTSFFPLDPFDDNTSSFSIDGSSKFYFVLNNDNVLLSEYRHDFSLYSIPRACLTNSYSFRNQKFCSNEKFLYRSNKENSMIIIYNLNTFDFVVKEFFVRDMAVVENGVILLTAKNIPELWNKDLTKLVYSFDELKVEFKDEIIYCMWHEDKQVNGSDDVIKEEITNLIAEKDLAEWNRDITRCINYAAFSPSADKLLIFYVRQYLEVFDVENIQIIYSFTEGILEPKFFFVDDRL
ncbi:uncharacterized protein LOC124452065 [Xenia sp. Carnegie-2017]|uniref:uncharacterized protein LOC124452065 n=1 Tax=Xenia sp. Carnegie-2017 TaxID=2897299 RepID=UPI001F039D8D|nr:uncharacterized protein LOC124452065 [Xenia sp. Carnegie-2017]